MVAIFRKITQFWTKSTDSYIEKEGNDLVLSPMQNLYRKAG